MHLYPDWVGGESKCLALGIMRHAVGAAAHGTVQCRE